MVNWAVVAAYIGPLVGAMAAVSTWFTVLGRRRDEKVAGQIRQATAAFEARITQVETAITTNSRQLDKQGEALIQAVTAIARIEGRLSGQVQAQAGS